MASNKIPGPCVVRDQCQGVYGTVSFLFCILNFNPHYITIMRCLQSQPSPRCINGFLHVDHTKRYADSFPHMRRAWQFALGVIYRIVPCGYGVCIDLSFIWSFYHEMIFLKSGVDFVTYEKLYYIVSISIRGLSVSGRIWFSRTLPTCNCCVFVVSGSYLFNI